MYIPVELLALGIIRYSSFVCVIAQLSELLLDYGTIRRLAARPEVPNVCFSWRSEGRFPHWDENHSKKFNKKAHHIFRALLISSAFRAACGGVDVSRNKHKAVSPTLVTSLSLFLFLSLGFLLHARASSSSSFKRRREDDDDRVFVFVFVCGGIE